MPSRVHFLSTVSLKLDDKGRSEISHLVLCNHTPAASIYSCYQHIPVCMCALQLLPLEQQTKTSPVACDTAISARTDAGKYIIDAISSEIFSCNSSSHIIAACGGSPPQTGDARCGMSCAVNSGPEVNEFRKHTVASGLARPPRCGRTQTLLCSSSQEAV